MKTLAFRCLKTGLMGAGIMFCALVLPPAARSEDGSGDSCSLSKTVEGSIILDRKKLSYKRHLDSLVLHDESGNSTACISYVAYTTGPAAKRPVTFFFNGGPGSSGLFLQLGSFGPLRIRADSRHGVAGPPYDIGNNAMTLLDMSDLVFVDPVGTGFSHPLGQKKKQDFLGVDQDAAASADFVTTFLNDNKRWNVPLYLFGESYGTTRIAVTSRILSERGIALNGLIFMSTVLNYAERLPGVDLTTAEYLPSYAAVAWFHHMGAYQDLDLNEVVSQAHAYATGDYMSALWEGNRLDKTAARKVAEQLSRYTGLSVPTIMAHALRVDVNTFRSQLLGAEDMVTGRYDARAVATASHGESASLEFDPSNENVRLPLLSIWNSELVSDFGYDTRRPYIVYDNGMSAAWDWRHKVKNRPRPVETAVTGGDLTQAMNRNPYMRVIFFNGLYDLATPFSLTAYDVAHLDIGEKQMRNITFCRYPGGHMIYFDENALNGISHDLHEFYMRRMACH